MRDLTNVLQELHRHELNCRVESLRGRGFRIVLGDDMNGELASLDVQVEELPGAGDRLWELACRHVPGLGQAMIEPNFWPAEKVVPLSRVIGRAVPENIFPVDALQDPVMESDVLAYAVVSSNEQCETVWYLNTQGEVRQEALGLREGWRQSDRFRYGEEKSVEQFQHLYLEPERVPAC
jgi:hypothetical protein